MCPRYRAFEGPEISGNESGTAEVERLCLSLEGQRLFYLRGDAMVTILKAENQTDLERCLAVRRAVFTVERGVPASIEVDGDDRLDGPCEHFAIVADGVDVGALRCRQEGGVVRFQRFCVLKDCRKNGHAREAVRLIEEHYRTRGVFRIELDAKFEVHGFYEKCGYQTVSEPFEEAGIPHVKMEKAL